jgi:hypothetical protein
MHQYLFYLHEYGWKNARTKQRANCKEFDGRFGKRACVAGRWSYGVGAWRYLPVAAACWSPWKLSTRCGLVASPGRTQDFRFGYSEFPKEG